MKKVFAIAFIIGFIVSLFVGQPMLTAGSLAGLAISVADYKVSNFNLSHFRLQIVPGKFVVTKTDNNQMVEEVPYMSRAQKAIFDQLITLRRANPVTQSVIDQGGISFDPISYYIRANITAGAGRQQIVNNSLIQIVGVTNIPNGGSLPQYYNFCFDRVAVRYAVANSANANVASMTGFSAVRGSMPAALGNGHLIVSSNSNKIVETPICDFTTAAATTAGGERDYDCGTLENPRFFLELINIEVEIAYAQNQIVPSVANNTYAVEIVFMGSQARLKA